MITQVAYAKHRGVSKMAVSRAVSKGRLRSSVVRDTDGSPLGLTSIEDADREWAANSDYTDAPQRLTASEPTEATPNGEPSSLADAAMRAKFWDAALKELKYKEAAGELVEAKGVSRKLVDVFTQCKTRLLAVPSRARQALPHLTITDIGTLEELIREALSDLTQSPE